MHPGRLKTCPYYELNPYKFSDYQLKIWIFLYLGTDLVQKFLKELLNFEKSYLPGILPHQQILWHAFKRRFEIN